MSFSVHQEAFQGPLALLLELIDERKLEITQVSLAQVADAFLARLQEVAVPEEEMAEFLVVAARLIYIKSKELLPYVQFSDEEDAADRLEDRLRAYKEFVDAARRLEEMWGMRVMYTRRFMRQARDAGFYPAQNITQDALAKLFGGIVTRLAPFFALREQRVTRTVSVEERVVALRQALHARTKMHFAELVAVGDEPAHIVVSFLALLEMLRRQEVHVAQDHSFAHIEIMRSPEA